jgi:hypothetical protein
MICYSPFRAPCPGFAAVSVTLFFLLLFLNSAHAQENSPASAARIVPTFDALPHVSLPQGGRFKIWCGNNDRLLLDVNGALEAHDAGVKSAAIAVSSIRPAQCSEDGQKLVYVDTNMGYVTKVDIASGASRLPVFLVMFVLG